MYQLKVDGDVVSTHRTLEEAFKARNEKVREICLELYDNDEIDKYAVEDWCSGLDTDKSMEYYIDEGCGYSVEIVKDGAKDKAPAKARVSAKPSTGSCSKGSRKRCRKTYIVTITKEYQDGEHGTSDVDYAFTTDRPIKGRVVDAFLGVLREAVEDWATEHPVAAKRVCDGYSVDAQGPVSREHFASVADYALAKFQLDIFDQIPEYLERHGITEVGKCDWTIWRGQEQIFSELFQENGRR